MNCVHLDFHTSPHIDGIGKDFNKAEFTKTIKEAGIDLVTVFAKCHHGYTYYPSRVAEMHPGLSFNLLKEEIEAIHDAGAKAPIYITVGWCKKDADEHPDWHHLDFKTGEPIVPKLSDDPSAPLTECYWYALCPVGDYLSHLEEITHEVCRNFDTSDGVFYDICFVSDACGCESCKSGMRKKGLNPESIDDARLYYKEKRIEMMQKLTSIVHSYTPDAPVFYNGGADMNRTEYHPYQTHYELEDLPTAWGGYDLMPLRAKFFEKYGKHFLGMTGKFHHAWGEFGGFKDKRALTYECCDMLSVGASISVGDHLHPSGKLDESTYKIIGHAFGYVNSIKEYCTDTRACADLAIWLSHNYDSDMGASKLLQNMHLEYDTVGSGDSLDKYKCIILPEYTVLSESDKKTLLGFTKDGGRLIACYDSVFDELGVKKIAPSEYDLDYIKCELEDYTTPFLAYSSAYKTECSGEVLAEVYEPYFIRTLEHFCGHKNTPNRTTPADYPALVKVGNLLYFAHPVFKAYNDSGNYPLERYIANAIESVYDRSLTVENLPSTGRVRLRESEQGKFLALHLLYAPPVNRGNVCLLPDFPTLYGVEVKLKTARPVKSVITMPEGTPLPFEKTEDGVSFKLPPFSLHKLAVLKW